MKKIQQLTAENLKATLWETLNELKSEKITSARGQAIAMQAREILKTTNVQLRVARDSGRAINPNVISFSEK